MNGTDDYLRQAADSANWPKTVGGSSFAGYAPNGDGVVIGSLGVFEHWNDSTHKQYSRNLNPGTGKGIELVFINQSTVALPYPTLTKTTQASVANYTVYPNPVHTNATISYSLAGTSSVQINLIAINGTKISSIVNQSQQPEGEYKAQFDASSLSSGVYICEFVVNGKNVCTKQIQIIK
jgi:hypothetical protein